MYAIKEGAKKINGVVVTTYRREVRDGNAQLAVEAGTTGYTGCGCRNAGGRTCMDILCLEGDFHFEPIRDEDGRNVGVTIACCGDDGLDAIVKAVDFAREAISDQCCGVDD